MATCGIAGALSVQFKAHISFVQFVNNVPYNVSNAELSCPDVSGPALFEPAPEGPKTGARSAEAPG